MHANLDISLAHTDREWFIEEFSGDIVKKKCLREALNGAIPDWVRYRPKIVLSEGVGLGGNHLTKGMFHCLAENKLTRRTQEDIQHSFPEWNIRSGEEAYYFMIFHELGYSKAKFMQERVTANLIHSTQ